MLKTTPRLTVAVHDCTASSMEDGSARLRLPLTAACRSAMEYTACSPASSLAFALCRPLSACIARGRCADVTSARTRLDVSSHGEYRES